jgi:drug/metabolite transporter (DMT)-like permease
MPIFTSVFAALTPSEERLSPTKVGGLAIGFLGVIVLIGPGALDIRSGVGVPHAAVIASALSYGGVTVYARRLSKAHTVLDLTAVKLALAAIAAVALSTAIDGPMTNVSFSAAQIGALIGLGVVSTGLGRLIYLWVIAKAGSVRASLVTYIIPVSALALGWFVLGESIDANMVGGAALVVLGVAGASFSGSIALIPRALPRRSKKSGLLRV